MKVYSSLPTNEENDHDGSIVGKWPIDPRRVIPSWHWAWGFSFVWTVVNLVGSIFLLKNINSDDRFVNPAGFVPRFHTTLVAFQIEPSSNNFTTSSSMDFWADIAHIGRQGWVIVNEPRKFPWLGHGLPMSRGREKFVYSAFHNLHCLALIQQDYTAKLIQNDTMSKEYDHVEHCFDYIRQSIQCLGDLTMEGRVEGTEDVDFNGWDKTHQCVDWDSVMRFVMTAPGHDKDLSNRWS